MRSLHWLLAGSMAIAATGCDEKKPAPPSIAPSATASSPVASCADRSKRLGEWLEAAKNEGMGPPPPYEQMQMKLVESSDGDPWAWFGAALLVNKDALQLDFEKIGPPSEDSSREKLSASLKQRAQSALAAGISMGLDLYIHPDTPWSSVTALFDAVAASGFRTVGIVFAAPTKLQSPKSDLLAALRDADQKGSEQDLPIDEPVPDPADKALSACRPAISLLREIGKREMTAKDKVELFAQRAPGAWQSCLCRVDEDVIKTLHWHWLARSYGPPTRSFKLLVAAGGDKEATTIAAGTQDPWSKVSGEIVRASKDGKRVAFTAKD